MSGNSHTFYALANRFRDNARKTRQHETTGDNTRQQETTLDNTRFRDNTRARSNLTPAESTSDMLDIHKRSFCDAVYSNKIRHTNLLSCDSRRSAIFEIRKLEQVSQSNII